jgi:competence protein ComEC
MANWPLNKAYLWEKVPFLRLLLPLITGIICYSVIPINKTDRFLPLAAVTIISFALFILLSFKKGNAVFEIFKTLSAVLILVLIGWLFCYLNDVRNKKDWFGNTISKNAHYIARLNSVPTQREKSWKLDVSVLHSIQNDKIKDVKGNAFIYVSKDGAMPDLQEGDTVLIPGNWQSIKNPGNPYEFDYAGYCAKNNLYYRQFIPANEISLLSTAHKNNLDLAEKAHVWCMNQLQTYLPDSATMGLLQAMLLGDEINLDEHLLHAYSETGIVHIIAISGGNVAIFFFVISFLLFWIRNKKYRWIKYLVALPLVWFYVIVAGASPSAIRAAVMFSVLAVGLSFQKPNNSLNQLFATAFLLLCAEPMWLYSVGFQLSFVAVLSLIIFYKPIYNIWPQTNSIMKGLWSTVCASCAAEILVAPLVIYYFHLFPLLFLVANVIAYLFMSMVLVLGMAILLFSFLPALAILIGRLTVLIVSFFDTIVFKLQHLNPESFHFLYLRSFELLLVYVVVAGLGIFILKKQKPGLFISLIALCLLLVSFCRNKWMVIKQQKLVVYNIPGYNYIEKISGTHYCALADTIDKKRETYILISAHTAWQAWREEPNTDIELLTIGKETILILDNPKKYTGASFHTDYVILDNISKQNLEDVRKTFSPKLIVLSSGIKSNTIDHLMANSPVSNTNIYSVSKSGAFILEGF